MKEEKMQRQLFNEVYGDVEKARRLLASPIRMFYEERTLDFGIQGLETAQGNCLDLGCGRGIFTHFLLDRFRRVVASDFAECGLKTAKRVLSSRELDFVASNGNALPLKNECFDFVIIKDFIHHLDEPEKAMREIYRILRFGGYLISVEPNNRNILSQIVGRMMKHERKFVKNSPAYLLRFVSGFGFHKVHMTFENFYVAYGPFYKLPPKVLPCLQKFEEMMKRMFPSGGGHFIVCYQKR